MRLKLEYQPNKPSFSIAGAIEYSIEHYADREGMVEIANARSEHTLKLLASVIQLLHERYILSTDELLSLLPGMVRVEEPPSNE